MISITTKTGDKGESGLANGTRHPKNSSYFEVIGALDELNSWLGLVAAKWDDFSGQSSPGKYGPGQYNPGQCSLPLQYKEYLYKIQDILFRVGAEVAHSSKVKLTEDTLTDIENAAHKLQESLAEDWHTKFLLPGGTEMGALLDITRTVCRRCERVMVAHVRTTPLSSIVIKYLNRLSDYLYLLRCFVNHTLGRKEKEFLV